MTLYFSERVAEVRALLSKRATRRLQHHTLSEADQRQLDYLLVVPWSTVEGLTARGLSAAEQAVAHLFVIEFTGRTLEDQFMYYPWWKTPGHPSPRTTIC